MAEYVERFKAMVKEIESHPLLAVKEFTVRPAASPAALEAARNAFGKADAKPILDFYAAANGLTLRWTFRDSVDEQTLAQYDDYEFERPDSDEYPFAAINLITIEECLETKRPEFEVAGADATFEFRDKTYPYTEFGRRLKPFDLAGTYYCMSFVLLDDAQEVPVMLLSDHCIEWDSSRITDFPSYLEMLLATRGIVEARKTVYSEYRGDKKPPLRTPRDYWTGDRIPRLFQQQ